MDNMIFIKKFSKPLSLIFKSLVVLVPLATLSYWIFYNSLPSDGAFVLRVANPMDLDTLTRSFLFIVSMIPVSVVTYGLYKMARLFELYSKGIVFSAENVKYYRELGYITLAWVIAHFIYTPLVSLTFTLNISSMSGTHIGLHPSDLVILVLGIIVVMISKVMDEARKLETSHNSATS